MYSKYVVAGGREGEEGAREGPGEGYFPSPDSKIKLQNLIVSVTHFIFDCFHFDAIIVIVVFLAAVVVIPDLAAECENVTCDDLPEDCENPIHFSSDCCPVCSELLDVDSEEPCKCRME